MTSVEQHIFSAFRQVSLKHPDKPALVFFKAQTQDTFSYRSLLDDAVRLGEYLKAQGVLPQDKIILLMDSRPAFVQAFLAVMYARAVAVPLDVQYSLEQVRAVMDHCQARVVLLTERVQKSFPDLHSPVPAYTVDAKAFQSQWSGLDVRDVFQKDSASDDVAMLFYTSGTTACPKAVMLTHANLLSNVYSIYALNIARPQDVFLSILPLHHAYAFTSTLLIPLLCGASVVYPAGMNSLELAKAMKSARATILVGVPQVFALLERAIQQRLDGLPWGAKQVLRLLSPLAAALRRLTGVNFSRVLFQKVHSAFGGRIRYCVSGGAKLDIRTARVFTHWGFTVLEGYGLTETSPVAALTPPRRVKLGSVGKALPGGEIKIIHPDETGMGEVLIKGPNVMKGYFKAESETDTVLKEGWFSSGDLGRLDGEGYLYILGRIKEMIVLSSGKNIYPEDVEKEYSQISFIKEIAVLSSKEGAFMSGTDHLVAIVVIDEEQFRLQQVSGIRDKIKWEMDNISARLPSYKRVQSFMISQDPLPRTRLGKIKRYQLEEIYSCLSRATSRSEPGQHLSEETSGQFENMTQFAMSFIQQTLQRDVQEKDHLELDLGLDSLGRIELLLNIQERLNLELDDEQSMDFFMCNTIHDLMEQLRQVVPNDVSPVKEDAAIQWGRILTETPQEKTVRWIKLSFGFLARVFNIIVITFFKLFFKVLFLMRTEGEGHLPRKGPYLICPNHTSYLDGLFILCALPYSIALQTYFVGYRNFFENGFLRPFIKIARLIPLEVSYNLIEALKGCAYVLRYDKVVCYFPEGQRSIDGEMNKFKKGVGILVKELNVPVVPVYLDGAFKTWPRTRRFPRLAAVKVCFSAPVSMEGLVSGKEDGHDIYDEIAENLRARVGSIKQHCIKK
ncbi:MAG TPA: AMP-binding protein [Candidatus Omnitrophota bacterium]|nr:AMP-binding protein [Candidatus Omnitrophota bacterium]